MSEPIKYSDLIQADDSIKNLLSQLKDANKELTTMQTNVAKAASIIKESLKNASVATSTFDSTLEQTNAKTAELARLNKELANAEGLLEAAVKRTAEILKQENAAKTSNSSNTKKQVVANKSAKDSYEALKKQLKEVIATYSALSKEEALQSEKGTALLSTITALTAQVSRYETALKTAKKSATESANAQSSLNNAKKTNLELTRQERIELEIKNQVQKKVNTEIRLQATIATTVAGTYENLSAKYRLAKIRLNELATASNYNSVEMRDLQAEAYKLYGALNELQMKTGQHALNVGNYRKQWDGLGASVNQLVREAPVLGISLNTFFLAISNNLPIFFDELKRAKEETNALLAAGAKAPSVSSRIIKSLLSFNTVLIVAVTILSKYGKQIFEWVGNLFKGVTAVDALKKAQETLNKVTKEGVDNAQKDLARVELLAKGIDKANTSEEKRLRLLEELKESYPDYIRFLDEEASKNNELVATIDAVRKSILAKAHAQAVENEIAEKFKERLKIEKDILDTEKEIAYLNTNQAVGVTSAPGADPLERAKNRLERYKLDLEIAKTTIDTLVNSVDIDALLSESEPKGGSGRGSKADPNLAIKKRYEESLTNLTEDELEKRKQAMVDSHNAEIRSLEHKIKTEKKLTEESKKLIGKIIINDALYIQKEVDKIEVEQENRSLATTAQSLQYKINLTEEKTKERLDLELALLENSKQQELNLNSVRIAEEKQTEIAILADFNKKKLDLIKAFSDEAAVIEINNQKQVLESNLANTLEGSLEQHQVLLAQLELQKQEEIILNRQKIEAEKQDELSIIRKWDAIITEQVKKLAVERLEAEFEGRQALEESVFELTNRSEYRRSAFARKQEIERWELRISLAEAGLTELTEKELAAYKNLVEKLKSEVEMPQDLFDVFNVNVDENQKSAFQTYADSMVESIQSVIQAQADLTAATIAETEKRIETLQSEIAAEKEARNQGYASSAAQAEKLLALEQKTLDREKVAHEKQQKALAAIDTVTQISSLITASAQIFKSLAGIPFVGVPLAIAMTATMFGAFIAAKAKASSVASETYGEGTLEFLSGGSHASGNDIVIGRTKSGKQRRAEGGEAMMILNKNKTNKYRSILPTIHDSLSNGTFENIFNSDANNLVVHNSSANLKPIENLIKELIEEVGTKDYIDSKGRHIQKKKNLTVITK